MARRWAPALGRDCIEEVVQRAWLLLLGKPAGRFDPKRGTALSYATAIARTSLRDVWAAYAPPGQPTRPRRADGGAEGAAARGRGGTDRRGPVSLDQAQRSGDGTSFTLGQVLEAVTPEPDFAAAAESDLDTASVLAAVARAVSPELAMALHHVCHHDRTLSDAARAVGMDRSTLSRQVRGLADVPEVLAFLGNGESHERGTADVNGAVAPRSAGGQLPTLAAVSAVPHSAHFAAREVAPWPR
jgi:hypothetical protein